MKTIDIEAIRARNETWKVEVAKHSLGCDCDREAHADLDALLAELEALRQTDRGPVLYGSEHGWSVGNGPSSPAPITIPEESPSARYIRGVASDLWGCQSRDATSVVDSRALEEATRLLQMYADAVDRASTETK